MRACAAPHRSQIAAAGMPRQQPRRRGPARLPLPGAAGSYRGKEFAWALQLVLEHAPWHDQPEFPLHSCMHPLPGPGEHAFHAPRRRRPALPPPLPCLPQGRPASSRRPHHELRSHPPAVYCAGSPACGSCGSRRWAACCSRSLAWSGSLAGASACAAVGWEQMAVSSRGAKAPARHRHSRFQFARQTSSKRSWHCSQLQQRSNVSQPHSCQPLQPALLCRSQQALTETSRKQAVIGKQQIIVQTAASSRTNPAAAAPAAQVAASGRD